ncbi:hypothetical protein ACFSJY_04160 [Thalassotalea euphylliae]|uniref:hypothetical protein n=1 Tax=Thalassotalea euphylliae TaxID=1655234 RepID=UPI00363FB20F
MLYLFLFKFALFLGLCLWLTRHNNLSIKLWSDEQLINSLPKYQHMCRSKEDGFPYFRIVNAEERVKQIKEETQHRFRYDRVRTMTLNRENKATLLQKLERKLRKARYVGNNYATTLIAEQIEEIVRH